MNALTDSQRQAIKARGNVLVVAGAGTGKTSTLVHRCLNLLLEENCSLDQILMVTFTEAAAAQMRSRIRTELLRLQDGLPNGSAQAGHVQKQIALLDTAHICTLHSFCLQLVRTHFYQLGIDPAIVVLDERQTGPLISQTLDALFRRYYAAEGPEVQAVQSLIRQMGGGSDERIRHRLVRLHRYTQALEDPERWLAAQEAIYQQPEPIAWRQWFQAGLHQWRSIWLPELQPYSHVPAVHVFIEALAALPEQPTFEEGSQTLHRLREANEDRENWPRGTKAKKALKQFLAELEFLASLMPSSQSGLTALKDPLLEDWQWARPHVCALLRLTREFSAAFSKAKRELGGVDFSDLEQFALCLLRDSAIARQWQQRLRFIFVDECQDINRAQDAILVALSREDTQPNRFLVGDVKQSIYRFRLADPKIFGEYDERWGQAGSGGTRIPLADNFRSREALLCVVNSLFAALMRPEIGGVAYQKDVHLRFGSAGQRQHISLSGSSPAAAPRVELHLIHQAAAETGPADANEDQSQSQPEPEDLLSIEREARLVAMRLRELRAQKHSICDAETQQFRPVEWRDMVVLMRSPSDRAEAFAKEFNRLGVPLCAARSGFFESTEISDLLSLLKLIDNPLQDVPLLAVLHSPLAGISLDELVEIRAHNRQKPFWLALRTFHGKSRGHEQNPNPQIDRARADDCDPAFSLSSPGGEGRGEEATHPPSSAWSKADTFLRHFDRWRELARQSSVADCLEMVLADTYYEALVLAEPRGQECMANVRRFLELAREYDPFRRQGLYRFLRFVQAQEEAEVDLEPASAQTEDAVRLMSIHKSKGLEFPVVILAGLGIQFNLQDLREDILLHETYGLCPKVKPPQAEQSYPSLSYWLARRDQKRELLGEEMRLLYVALTRARDTLILTGGSRTLRWSHDRAGCESALSTAQIAAARSYLDWLLMWLAQVAAPADWRNQQEGQTALVRWRTYASHDSQFGMNTTGELNPAPLADVAGELDQIGLLRLQERLLWRYPFSAATSEPAVKRVSSLIRERAEPADDAQLAFNYDSPKQTGSRGAARKRPPSKLRAVDIGSAHHRFLEMAHLTRLRRLQDLKLEAARLLEDGALTKEQIEMLDFNGLLAFWNSAIGQRILSHTPNVHREIPFTARFSPADFASLNLCATAEALQDEYFVVRGQADLAVLLPREIWLLDFKTDAITEAESAGKIQLYAPQLKLYALALSRIYSRPVTNQWLHFLALGKTIPVR